MFMAVTCARLDSRHRDDGVRRRLRRGIWIMQFGGNEMQIATSRPTTSTTSSVSGLVDCTAIYHYQNDETELFS